MSRTRACINIYVPTVSRFPEYNVIGGIGYSELEQDHHTQLPALDNDKSDTSDVAGVAAAVMEDDLGVEGSGSSLFVVDSKGRMLEHVRYQGNDYRSALRAAINTTPKHWRD